MPKKQMKQSRDQLRRHNRVENIYIYISNTEEEVEIDLGPFI